jgi:hypothetical protein
VLTRLALLGIKDVLATARKRPRELEEDDVETVATPITVPICWTELLSLSFIRLDLSCTALDPILLDGAKLRGALGCQLRRLSPDVATYSALFEPNLEEAVRGSKDAPPPYIFLPPTSNIVERGHQFTISMRIFASGIAHQKLLVNAVKAIGQQGLHGAKFAVTAVEQTQPRILSSTLPVSLPDTLAIHWNAPVRLKDSNDLAKELPFDLLIRSIFRRLQLMGLAHAGLALCEPPRELFEAAKSVTVVRSQLEWHDQSRFSTRQKRTVPTGGLVGSVIYQGDLAPFRQLLGAGRVLHVGKNCAFGQGAYSIELVDEGDLL